jgi:hypothetical protein
MNTDTGEIKEIEKEQVAKEPESKKMIMLTPDQARRLKPMNRHERRKYYATHKNEFKGQSWSDVKHLI